MFDLFLKELMNYCASSNNAKTNIDDPILVNHNIFYTPLYLITINNVCSGSCDGAATRYRRGSAVREVLYPWPDAGAALSRGAALFVFSRLHRNTIKHWHRPRARHTSHLESCASALRMKHRSWTASTIIISQKCFAKVLTPRSSNEIIDICASELLSTWSPGRTPQTLSRSCRNCSRSLIACRWSLTANA